MKQFRTLIALSLSLSLVVLSPGTGAYNAAAQTMGAATSGSAATGVTGVAGANLGRAPGVNAVPALSPSALTLTSVLGAPSIAPSMLQNAAVAPAASLASPIVANAAAVSPAALTATTPAAAKALAPVSKSAAPAQAAVSALKADLAAPAAADKPAETQAAEARQRFDGEALKTDLSAPAVEGKDVAARGAALKAAKKDGMPDEPTDEIGNSKGGDGKIDDLGNPSRTGGENGPDDRTDPDQNNRGGNGLLGMFGVGLLGGAAATVAGLTFGSIALFPMIILSLVLHEIGHARVAARLGDPSPRLSSYEAIDWRRIGETRLVAYEGTLFPRLSIPKKIVHADRGSLNPLTWGSHIDPLWTVLIPGVTFMLTGMIFGGARPVQMDPELRYFKNKVRDMAAVALAGPAVNAGLAVAGALAITGALAAGLGAGVVAMLGMFVFLNVLLAIFNLIPLPPLDGSHILKLVLPQQARDAMDGFMNRMGGMSLLVPMLILFYFAGGWISGAAALVSKLLIGGAINVTGVQVASAFLPAVAALGLAVGQIGAAKSAGRAAAQEAAVPGPSGPGNGGAASSGGNAPVDLIVMFGEKRTTLHDAHITNVDVNLPSGVEQYTRLQQAMLAQLETAGLDSASLEPYKGTPIATYARINAATIRVDGASAAEFAKDMAARGFTVHANSVRKIIRPVPTMPECMDPESPAADSMDENLKITKADLVQAEGVKKWGKPDLGFWSGLWAKVFKTEPAQPKFGVIDSGADTSHPLLKRVKEVKNMTSGENVDDIGHGSWVTSTVLHMAPWSKNTTHYKTFLNGSATTDDILKSLTQAGNDGNLVISNSWGDDEGDPNGPDALLVKKLAAEGHIMVFAAGNAGSGKNTIGAPAIVTYKDSATGAIRVIAVAASDKTKKVAYFSSRGPGSPKTAKDPSYKDHRPDAMAVGHNIEGAWPANLGDADRTDGEKGPVKAISGTSMSTPGFAGAIALLVMMFGVTEKGEKLDAIVNAVMSTLEKTGKNTVDEEGEGFLNVDAAYKKLQAQFSEVPSDVARFRALSKRLGELNRFINMTGSWKYGVMINDGEYSRAIAERKSVLVTLTAMKKADYTLAYRAAGPIKRLILNATGAAPKP